MFSTASLAGPWTPAALTQLRVPPLLDAPLVLSTSGALNLQPPPPSTPAHILFPLLDQRVLGGDKHYMLVSVLLQVMLFKDLSLSSPSSGQGLSLWVCSHSCDMQRQKLPQSPLKLMSRLKEITGDRQWLEGSSGMESHPLGSTLGSTTQLLWALGQEDISAPLVSMSYPQNGRVRFHGLNSLPQPWHSEMLYMPFERIYEQHSKEMQRELYPLWYAVQLRHNVKYSIVAQTKLSGSPNDSKKKPPNAWNGRARTYVCTCVCVQKTQAPVIDLSIQHPQVIDTH